MIPYGRQTIDQNDIDAVIDVLRSDFLTQGPAVPRFEKALTDYCGAHHAVAVNSATSALHIACLALGLGPGDWLWTTPITFVASANCALYCGAKVDFVDIDSTSYNISCDALKQKLIVAKRKGVLPKIVVAVHMTGHPCEMARLRELSQRYGFFLIEDAAHAIGAKYCDTIIGDCAYSDMTVFSFHPVKIVTSGEGGAVMTNDGEWARKLDLFRSHGITRDPQHMSGPSHGPWYYEQVALGYNYRMTDIQAALGHSQMRHVDEFVQRRHEQFERYGRLLMNDRLLVPVEASDCVSAHHLYMLRLKGASHEGRRNAFERLRAAGIGVNVHYIPVHLQPWFKAMGFKEGDFPQAEAYYREAITLPLYPGLTEQQQDFIVREVLACLG
jgi:UDP-4-amino-4,6-dideoxy-N-acetyl-beta-L-altrosamine transaminase